jgi:hypothetical protein
MYERIDEQTQWAIARRANLPRPQDLPDFPEDDPLAQEWKTFKREVGRLLAEGQTGGFAVIKGDAVISVWDTRSDAVQAAREKFGLGGFMVHQIVPVERPIRCGYLLRCQP